jgi:hypothetical protein
MNTNFRASRRRALQIFYKAIRRADNQTLRDIANDPEFSKGARLTARRELERRNAHDEPTSVAAISDHHRNRGMGGLHDEH